MTDAETRILKNQVEIMWALSYLLSKSAPDLVGRNGEMDRMREDLAHASKKSRAMVDAGAHRSALWSGGEILTREDVDQQQPTQEKT